MWKPRIMMYMKGFQIIFLCDVQIKIMYEQLCKYIYLQGSKCGPDLLVYRLHQWSITEWVWENWERTEKLLWLWPLQPWSKMWEQNHSQTGSSHLYLSLNCLQPRRQLVYNRTMRPQTALKNMKNILRSILLHIRTDLLPLSLWTLKRSL